MAANEERRFLIFSMHGERYAFDLAHVAEVMEPAKSWPIPFAPPCYSGAVNFHGAIIAVMDLPIFLGLAPCRELEKIIVLDAETALLGFLVEHVSRIVAEQNVEFREAEDVNFALATLRLPEDNATLLDVDAIVRAAEIVLNG